MNRRDKMLLAGLGCAVAVGMVFVALAAILSWRRVASERAERPHADPDARARLFLRNEPGGDWGRAVVFREALTRGGQRCDNVDRQIMQRPGEWLVSCAPGYRYRFTFGPRGELERSERLP